MKTVCSQNNQEGLLLVPSVAKIKKIIRKVVFGSHVHCPWCHSRQVFQSEQRYRCRRCRKPFSLTSGTWLNNLKLELTTFYRLLWCWCNHLPIPQTQRCSGVSELTVRNWYEKFRVHIPKDLSLLTLKDQVQMDEAFFHKQAVVAAKDVLAKKVCLRVLDQAHVQKQHVGQFVVRHIEPGSQLFTDGGGHYKGIGKLWPVHHQWEVHSRWEFALTSEIEGLFGNLRTYIRRKYHHVHRSKLPLVVAEFEAFFNHPELFENPTNYLTKSLKLVPSC